MAAAYLDFATTGEFEAAIRRGDAPIPSSLRGKGKKREPIWSRTDLDWYIAPLAPKEQADLNKENLPNLI